MDGKPKATAKAAAGEVALVAAVAAAVAVAAGVCHPPMEDDGGTFGKGARRWLWRWLLMVERPPGFATGGADVGGVDGGGGGRFWRGEDKTESAAVE